MTQPKYHIKLESSKMEKKASSFLHQKLDAKLKISDNQTEGGTIFSYNFRSRSSWKQFSF